MISQSVNHIDDEIYIYYSLLVYCYNLFFEIICVVNLYIRILNYRTHFFSRFVCFRNCIHSVFSIKKNDEEDRATEIYRKNKIVLFPLLDMSGIKKFFAKIKREAKFGKAGEGHRLNDPSPSPRYEQPQPRPQTSTRQNSDGGAAARAAADAAQQRLQQQVGWQQSTTSSKNREV